MTLPNWLIRWNWINSPCLLHPAVDLAGPVRLMRRMAPRLPGLFGQQMKVFSRVARKQPKLYAKMVLKEFGAADRKTYERLNIAELIQKDRNEGYRQDGIGSWYDAMIPGNWPIPLNDISSKVYLWQGKQDISVSLAMGMYLAENIPDCEEHFIEGAGNRNRARMFPRYTPSAMGPESPLESPFGVVAGPHGCANLVPMHAKSGRQDPVTHEIKVQGRLPPGGGCGYPGELDRLASNRPRDIEDAERILRLPPGQVHRVHTGIGLLPARGEKLGLRSVCTAVKFAPLSEEDSEFYLMSGEWSGVTGACRIRERGAFFSVVGLP